MKTGGLGVYRCLRRLWLASALTAGLAMVGGGSPGAAQTVVDPDAIAGNAAIVSQLSPFNTTVAYVAQFYPLPADCAHHSRDAPVPAHVVFILMLDPYGDLLPASPPIPKMPGNYALIGPGFTGTVPANVTPIAMPLDISTLIFRADKLSPSGQDQSAQANAFRKSLKTQALSDYVNNPMGGTTTKIVPEIFLAVPFKTTADDLIAHDPIAFLRQLQRAVESDQTPPPSLTKRLSETGSTACSPTGCEQV
jgi:hypothetical protein